MSGPGLLTRLNGLMNQRVRCNRRCLYWTGGILSAVIIAAGVSALAVYLSFRPKIPKYSIDNIKITQFSTNPDNSLSVTFNVVIAMTNPNKNVGIYYERGSHLSVSYAGTELCEGRFPDFYQGHRNTTVVSITLTGQTGDASGLLQSMMAEQQSEGSFPLNLRAEVPVRLKLGKLKLTRWKFLVKCRVDVDSLSQANDIRVKGSKCKFG